MQSLYKRIHNAIRGNDQEKVIFFEPVQTDVLPVLEGMVFPIGFNDTPGGVEYNDRQILNDHTYCCIASTHYCPTGEPEIKYAEACRKFNLAKVTSRAIDAKILNVGLIITEFGGCYDTDNCVNEVTSVADACNQNLVGWAYWMFKGYGDFTTSASIEEGFYNNQTLQAKKVAALARTYVPYYQGTPISIYFNITDGYFSTNFMLDPTVTNSTIVFVSTEYYYTNGLVINTSSTNPNVVCLASSRVHNYYEINCVPLQLSNITVIITAK